MEKLSLIIAILLTQFSFSQPDGPNNPSSNSINVSIGTISWVNGGNGYTSNNTRAATANMVTGTFSQYLVYKGFGFSIPLATIDGIKVEIEHRNNGGSGVISDNSIKLVKAGAIVGSNLSTGVTWPGADTYVTYGGAANLWGTTWTDSDINDVNFGIAISCKKTGAAGNNKGQVDHVRITVYYTLTPLPIELLYFKTNVNSVNQVVLNWATASETNSYFFTIEKSINGFEFEEVTQIGGGGNSSSLIEYIYKYNTPDIGTSYYRLKQTDYDGKFKYSNVSSITIDSDRKKVVRMISLLGEDVSYDYKGIIIYIFDNGSILKTLNY